MSDGIDIPDDYKIGSPIIDAFYLANGSKGIKTKILIHYSSHPFANDLKSTDYNGNHFLDKLANHLINISSQQNANIASLLSSVGGLDVTNLADGLSKFIVKRAKQELDIAFLQKFKKVIVRNT